MRIFVDHGSEFSGRLLDVRTHDLHVQIKFSRPGKQTDNCFIETFDGPLCDECLNVRRFGTPASNSAVGPGNPSGSRSDQLRATGGPI